MNAGLLWSYTALLLWGPQACSYKPLEPWVGEARQPSKAYSELLGVIRPYWEDLALLVQAPMAYVSCQKGATEAAPASVKSRAHRIHWLPAGPSAKNPTTWTPKVCKIIAQSLLKRAPKAIILHTFGVQVHGFSKDRDIQEAFKRPGRDSLWAAIMGPYLL